MKIVFNFSLFLFVLLLGVDKSFSLTDYQIKNICRKEIRESTCIKNLKDKRYLLKKGNFIEIPVIPYKR
ncbi:MULTISPECIES: hypothetical protein [Prochlorococcus]|uniref:Uncharacterized protein n=1 Tax=Prochlorococcus marinus str. MIT 9116 TaxID=167544 RepID=A0A0A1ZV18_PROMR|nr:hypothetical protein [Prochlorococcus marinus]KGF89735.1 hypothetical protein EU92_1525 [Prochlorococcus marinus str. MIT 9107]KGF92416.1 hypothetical protein EU93_0681 [Prochlorococcus marinus str. MIT 9116]KGF92734.1 hypothetical protein EU94_1734 [Prochlorococcus marinus str. MIT 9123]